jgi:hypothetical protein
MIRIRERIIKGFKIMINVESSTEGKLLFRPKEATCWLRQLIQLCVCVWYKTISTINVHGVVFIISVILGVFVVVGGIYF